MVAAKTDFGTALGGTHSQTPSRYFLLPFHLSPTVVRALHLVAQWLEERPLQGGAQAFAELVDGQTAATKIVLRIA